MTASPSAVAALAALFAVPTLASAAPAERAATEIQPGIAEIQDAIRPAAAPQSLSLTDDAGTLTSDAVQGLEAPAVQAALTERDIQVLTEPIQTEEFFGVGLSSDAGEWAGHEAAVRVLEDEGWTPWLEVDTCASCDGLVLTGGATAVQVQISGEEELPPDLQVTLIPNNPSGAAVEIAEPRTATQPPDGEALAQVEPVPGHAPQVAGDHPAPASDVIDGRQLNIVSRDDWEAEETAPTTWEPVYYDVGAATLHHTAGTNSYTIEESAGLVRAIHYYHTVTLDWGDIGYNVLVDRFGQVFEGRKGTRTAPHGQTPQAAHAGSNSELGISYNRETFGLSVMGTYEHSSPAEHVFEQIEHLLVWQFHNAGINALGEHTFVGDNGSETHPRIFGHNAVSATVCPGPYIDAQIPTIRAEVAERTGW